MSSIAVQNALGFVATINYDIASRVQAAVNSLGNVTTLGYDAASQLRSIQNPLGFLWTTSYDPAGRSPAGSCPDQFFLVKSAILAGVTSWNGI